MSRATFCTVAGIVFGVVAAAHLARIATDTPIVIGTTAIPMWASWAGLAIAGALSVLGFRARA